MLKVKIFTQLKLDGRMVGHQVDTEKDIVKY